MRSMSNVMLEAPEPSLTAEDMVERARQLRPLLLESQAASEQLGAPTPEIHAALIEGGFYRAVQPRRFGGYEFTLEELTRIVIEVARGDPSVGWYYAFSAGHAQLLAQMFGDQAQADAFGPDGEFYAPSRLPMGTAVPVEGGWRINGRWDYCSGAPYANYFLPALLVPPADDPTAPPTEMAMAIVPRAKWTMLDDWTGVIGLRASGSNSIRIQDAVVPEHHLVRVNFLSIDLTKPPPGYLIHGNPMYAGRVMAVLHADFVAVAVGGAWAMLDEYKKIIETRETYTPPLMPRYQNHHYQRIYGLALGKIATAEAALRSTAIQHREIAARGMAGGDPFSPEEDMRLMAQHHHITELVLSAVDSLWRTAGTGAAKDGSRMQRYFRDFAMLRGHLSHQFEPFAEGLAKVHLGLEQHNLRAMQSADLMDSRVRKVITPSERAPEPSPVAEVSSA